MEQLIAVVLLAVIMLGFLALTEWGPRSVGTALRRRLTWRPIKESPPMTWFESVCSIPVSATGRPPAKVEPKGNERQRPASGKAD